MKTKLAFLKITMGKKNKNKTQIKWYLFTYSFFKYQHSSQFIFHVVPLLLSYSFGYKIEMVIRIEVIWCLSY